MKSAPLGHDREIMAAVLRQLVCDLCGDSHDHNSSGGGGSGRGGSGGGGSEGKAPRWDMTVRLWLLSSDNSSATCVATLAGHSKGVTSVAFHPTAPLVKTSSFDETVRLWR